MEISIREVVSQQDLDTFIHLPARLHKSYPYYVPSLINDEYDFHNPEKNKNLQQSEYMRFLCFSGTACVGRIMGIIFHPWNTKHDLKEARFFQPDWINDPIIAKALIEKTEQWARMKGMNSMVGSFGFSDKDPQGIQVEGFDHLPVIATVSHEPYLPKQIEMSGYTKFKDCVSYKMDIPEVFPSFYDDIYKRILHNSKISLLEFTKRSELKPFFVPVMELMNEAYRDIYGFVAMEKEDIEHLAHQYLQVIDPRLVKVVIDSSNKPVAFIIAMADISKGMQKSKGKLFPFGFIPILYEMKKSRQLNLLLGAVARSYRGRGLNVLLGVAVMKTARKLGMKIMDSHLILEENRMMRAELEKLGGTIYKRYRIYKKSLV